MARTESAAVGGAVDPADGEAPPTCTRHNIPKRRRNDSKIPKGWRYICSRCKREWDNRYRNRLRDEGMCRYCGREPAVTEARCGDCAIKLCEDAPRYRN